MKRFIAVLALLAALQGVSSAQQKGFQGFVSVGRNDPCPCGSGLKYKNCHGKGLV